MFEDADIAEAEETMHDAVSCIKYAMDAVPSSLSGYMLPKEEVEAARIEVRIILEKLFAERIEDATDTIMRDAGRRRRDAEREWTADRGPLV